MTKTDILDFINGLPSAYADTPWEGDFYSTVLKHGGGKWFGVILKASPKYLKQYGLPEDKNEVLNLKCPPDLSEFLCAKYGGGVLPAYHMNKKHWISIVLSSDVPDEDIKNLIGLSYDITGKGGKGVENCN